MAYTAHEYVGGAPPTTLAGPIGPTDGSFTLVNGTGHPDGTGGPFVEDINRGNATEEKILCSSRSGNAVIVAASGRGYDGTTASAHTSGEAVEHVWDAVSAQEANTAVVNTVGLIEALGDMLYGTGPNAMVELDIGTTGQILTVSGGVPTWATPQAGLLAYVQYGTVGNTTYTTSGTANTFTVVDATNLVTPSFVTPASGRILVRASAPALVQSLGNNLQFAIALDGVLQTASEQNVLAVNTLHARATYSYVLTGVAAGSHTVALWFAADHASSGDILLNAYNGDALIEVWSA